MSILGLTPVSIIPQTARFVGLAWLLLASQLSYAFSAIPVIRELKLEVGLPQAGVSAVYQDKTGFMWFGTMGGLARFDGHSVRVYHHDADDKNTLSDNTVESILQDSSGYLWVGTSNGLNRYDPRRETFDIFLHDAKNPYSLSDSQAVVVYEDRAKQIWIGSGAGLNLYDGTTGRFTRYIEKTSQYHNFIYAIAEDRAGVFWLATAEGIVLFDKRTKNFTPLQLQGFSGYQPPILEVLIDAENIAWIATDGRGLYRYDIQQKKQHAYTAGNSAIGSNSISSLVMDQDKTLWVGTLGGGIRKLNTVTGDFQAYTSRNTRHSIDMIMAMYKDRSQNLWFSTRMDGVFYMNPSIPFQLIRNDRLYNNVFSIMQDRHSTLWLGTANGAVRMDAGSDKTTVYRYPENLRGREIWQVFQDSEDNIWLCSNAGVDIYNLTTGKFSPLNLQHLLTDGDGLWAVNSVSEYGKGIFFIATGYGLYVWDKNKNTVKVERRAKFYNTFRDSRQRIWVLSSAGLYRWDGSTQTLSLFDGLKDKPYIRFSDITEDKNENLWLGSSAGLIRINADLQSVEFYKDKNKMFEAGEIFALRHDGQDSLWFTTLLGLWRFDLVTETISSYDVNDGLQGNEFNTAAYVAADGKMYFGGVNGISVFNPQDVKQAARISPPAVVITQLLIDNEVVDLRQDAKRRSFTQSITYTDELRLEHNQVDSLAVEFLALDYTAPARNRYAYKMEGLSEQWIYTDSSNRRAVFAGLPSGNYTLKIKVANSDGTWNEQGTHLKITILPPLWQTAWAYACYVLLLVLAVAGFVKFRTVKIRKQALWLEQQVEDRTREIFRQKRTIENLLEKKTNLLANISHEFRTPITLILGPLSRILQKMPAAEPARRDLQTARRNGQRLLKLVDQMLEFSRLNQSEQVKNPQALSEIVDAFAVSMQPLAAEKRLQFVVNNKSAIWVRATPDAIETILLNLLSNAFKYASENGSVHLQVMQSMPGRVSIVVRDNGPGIPEEFHSRIFERFFRLPHHVKSSLQGTGLGLALVKELVEANDGEIRLQSEIGKGSVFVVEFPCCEPVVQQSPEALPVLVSRKVSSRVSEEAELTPLSVANDVPGQVTHSNVQQNQEVVLVIDDTEDMCAYLASLLSEHYRLITALNGEQGLAIARNEIPDLIICDVMMPGIDGFKVLETVRSDMEISHIPIILLTAKDDKNSRRRGYQEIADDYITKPFDEQELLLRIRSLFTRRMLHSRKLSKELLSQSATVSMPVAGIDGDRTAAQAIMLTARDRIFLSKFKRIIEEHYKREDFSVEQMCQLLNMSERSLQKKVKALFDYTPNEYLRIFRVEKAAVCMQGKVIFSMAQLAQEVGFASQSYFANCFKSYFGVSPSHYLKKTVGDQAS